MNRQQLEDLIIEYTLDTLDDSQRQRVDELLATDPQAQQFFEEYQALTDTLVFAAQDVEPPQNLADNFIKRLQQERNQPHLNSHRENITALPMVNNGRKSIRTLSIALYVAATLLLVIGAVFFYSEYNRAQEQDEPTAQPLARHQDLYIELSGQENVTRHTFTSQNFPNLFGELLVTSDNEQAVLRLVDIPDRHTDQSYQLWLLTDELAISGGVFNWATGDGPYFIPIDPTLSTLQGIGMSLEPSGGSLEPTTDPFLVIDIQS